MLNRNSKNKNIVNLFLNNYFDALIAGVVILFLLAAYFLVLGPKVVATQQAIQIKINGEQSLYASSRRKLVGLQAIGDIYSKISPADLQKFNTVLPAAYVPERLYGELAEIVSSGGWQIGSITFNPSSLNSQGGEQAASASSTVALIGDPHLQAISFKITVSGIDYAGLQSLLHLLENNLRLFDVTSLTFSPSDNSASLVLSTYYYQVPK